MHAVDNIGSPDVTGLTGLTGLATATPDGAPVLVDLFSGCGGFSLGARRAGYRVGAAFDIDPILTSSYSANFPGAQLILRDISSLSGTEVVAAAGGRVAGIFGGPPCQGFSDIGRRDPADPRRLLLDHFFRLVQEVRPEFFVMENVKGLAYADARPVLDVALERVTNDYSIYGPAILDAASFGAATNRQRLFVIGTLKVGRDPLASMHIEALRRPSATVRAAIADLLMAVPIGDQEGFDVWRIRNAGRPSAYARSLLSHDRRFTGHRVTVHSDDVVRRFAGIKPGATDPIGRYPRLKWDGQCPALRAGTGSEMGSYQSVRPIHPDLPRVITVREAARLQGFPDRHLFHPTIWHSFRMIGNSVSPVMAEAIFRAVARTGREAEHLIAAE